MPSNLDFNLKLLAEAQKLGGFKYKKDTINAALEEFVRRRRQIEVTELFGLIDYNADYDYKSERKRK